LGPVAATLYPDPEGTLNVVVPVASVVAER
jgi:hypothetical protein